MSDDFNLSDYEMVADRLKRCIKDHPDLRVRTHKEELYEGREKVTRWIFNAEIFKSAEDMEKGLAWANGFASELESLDGINAHSALENCETSAIGRALANAGYSGAKRPSREEMEKVQVSTVARDLAKLAAEAPDVSSLHDLFSQARTPADAEIIRDEIKRRQAQ